MTSPKRRMSFPEVRHLDLSELILLDVFSTHNQLLVRFRKSLCERLQGDASR